MRRQTLVLAPSQRLRYSALYARSGVSRSLEGIVAEFEMSQVTLEIADLGNVRGLHWTMAPMDGTQRCLKQHKSNLALILAQLSVRNLQ